MFDIRFKVSADGSTFPLIQSDTVGWLTSISRANSVCAIFRSSRYRLRRFIGRIIGENDILSIGQSYIGIQHTCRVQKPHKNQTFWSRLKMAIEAREGRRLTQTAAVKRVGVTQATISGTWNKEGKGPEIATGIRLAKELGVSVDWLYTGREPMKPISAIDVQAAELLSVWNELDEKTKKMIVGYAIARANGLGDDFPFAKSSIAATRPSKATS